MTNNETRVLISQTGTKVHFPAIIGQQTTSQTACAPYGRMGARQMRLRFVKGSEKFQVNCARCLNTEGPKAPC